MDGGTMTRLPETKGDITARIEGEYRELPGLQLTLAQAVRLFDTDPRTTEAVLDGLVSTSFLRHAGTFYIRPGRGVRNA
jgi:hypothetical protein